MGGKVWLQAFLIAALGVWLVSRPSRFTFTVVGGAVSGEFHAPAAIYSEKAHGARRIGGTVHTTADVDTCAPDCSVLRAEAGAPRPALSLLRHSAVTYTAVCRYCCCATGKAGYVSVVFTA